MLKISELSQTEIKYICEHLPIDKVRKLFNKESKKFSRIKPGFRANTLSDNDIINILINNINDTFISEIIYNNINDWKNKTASCFRKYNEAGHSENKALIKAVLDNNFRDYPQLYFKLADKSFAPEYMQLVSEMIPIIGNMLKNTLTNKADNNKLQQEENKVREITAKLDQYKDKLELITIKFQNAEKEIAELQSELKKYHHLELYSNDEFIVKTDEQYPYLSIGKNVLDNNGNLIIERLADIIGNEIVPFIPDTDRPRTYDNRDKLYKNRNDKPTEEGTIAVWYWRSEPNSVDGSRDHVTTRYEPDMCFIEINEYTAINNVRKLFDFMTNWFVKEFISSKILFTFTGVEGSIQGILCSKSDFETSGDKVKLKKTVHILPCYQITDKDIVNLTDIKVYKKININALPTLCHVKEPFDEVKDLLLARANNAYFKENGCTKKDAQNCREYLNSIPVHTLAEQLAVECEYGKDEAYEYVKEFYRKAEQYLTDENVDGNIIAYALEHNEKLAEKCQKEANKKWSEDNKEKIEENQKLTEQKDELLLQINKFKDCIAEKEKLAADVENKIAERIQAAKNNAADFISTMAFVSPQLQSAEDNYSRCIEKIKTFNSKTKIVENFDNNNEEDNEKFELFEDKLCDNLIIAGYCQNSAMEIARIIRYSMRNYSPIIIDNNAVTAGRCLAKTINGEDLQEIILLDQQSIDNSLFEYLDKVNNNHVILIHGALDGYNINVFNAINSYIKAKCINKIILLSCEGIAVNMIPASLWNQALYIAGDDGIEKAGLSLFKPMEGAQDLFNITKSLAINIDRKSLMVYKRMLKKFSDIISNIQQAVYAAYLAEKI